MTYSEERELLKLARENNIMLRKLMTYLSTDNSADFFANILANLAANKIEQMKGFRNGMG